jgi:hypothetical protein
MRGPFCIKLRSGDIYRLIAIKIGLKIILQFSQAWPITGRDS